MLLSVCVFTCSDPRHSPDQLFPLTHQPAGARGGWINADMLGRHPIGAAHPSVHHFRETWHRRGFRERSGRRGQHRQRDHLHRQYAGGHPRTSVQEALRRRGDHAGEEERGGRAGRVRDEDEGGAAWRHRLVFLWGLAVDSGPRPVVAEDRTEDDGHWQLDRSAARLVKLKKSVPVSEKWPCCQNHENMQQLPRSHCNTSILRKIRFEKKLAALITEQIWDNKSRTTND